MTQINVRITRIRSFVDSIFKGKITLGEADKKQRILLENILEFNNRVRLRSKTDKKKTRDTYKKIQNIKI